jgi:hypothetical protein
MPFTVTPAVIDQLEVVANEASASGFHGVGWGDPVGKQSRLLYSTFQLAKPSGTASSAVEIARFPAGSEFTFSTSPAGLPAGQRWIFSSRAGEIGYQFWSREARECIPGQTIPFPGLAPRLIHPALAGKAPGTGAPSCVAGLLFASSGSTAFLPMEILGNGEHRRRQHTDLGRDVVGAWATTLDRDRRVFVFAVQHASKTVVRAITLDLNFSPAITETWLEIEGEFVAGNVLAGMGGGVTVGLIVRRGEHWHAVTFTAPVMNVRKKEQTLELSAGPGSSDPRARLDGTGRLHLLYKREQTLCYIPGGSAEPTWFSRRAAAAQSPQMVIPAGGRAVIIYGDPDDGLTFLQT